MTALPPGSTRRESRVVEERGYVCAPGGHIPIVARREHVAIVDAITGETVGQLQGPRLISGDGRTRRERRANESLARKAMLRGAQLVLEGHA